MKLLGKQKFARNLEKTRTLLTLHGIWNTGQNHRQLAQEQYGKWSEHPQDEISAAKLQNPRDGLSAIERKRPVCVDTSNNYWQQYIELDNTLNAVWRDGDQMGFSKRAGCDGAITIRHAIKMRGVGSRMIAGQSGNAEQAKVNTEQGMEKLFSSALRVLSQNKLCVSPSGHGIARASAQIVWKYTKK